MLTSRIRLLPSSSEPEEETQEDILSSSLSFIFPDDIQNQHGDAQNSVLYTTLTPSLPDITLSLADPRSAASLSLFSHFVWNAAVELSVFIEENKHNNWSVQGETVLELGAGTGLAGIVASFLGASEVVISDYPAQEILENIQTNVTRNINAETSKAPETVKVQGHEWGVLTDSFSVQNERRFTRLLVADCLWMPWQHLNLLRSIAHFLADGVEGGEGGKAWVIAGFHTGREKMSGFYEEAKMREVGLEVEKIWERNAEGDEREWVVDRGVEDVTERKRWLVIAVLRRRKQETQGAVES